MPALSALRASLRAQLAAVFAACPTFADCDPSQPLCVTARWDGVEVSVTLTVEQFRELFENIPDDEPTDASFPPIEAAILHVATSTPQTAKTLARLAGRPCNSSFRSALASLCRRAPYVLIHTPDGYRTPDRT